MNLPRNSEPRSRAKRIHRTALGAAATVAVTVAVIAAGGIALAQEQEGVIVGAATDDVVAGSYIVVYKDGANPAAADLTTRYGGRVSHIYQEALHGFAVNGITDKQARRLAGNKDVAQVSRDQIVQATETQRNPASWGLDRIDQRRLPLDNAYTYPRTTSDATVYVIDSGIDMSHPEFGGRAVSGIDTFDNDTDASDCSGHGTAVASIVGGNASGVAKQVKLVAVRALGCDGTGSASTVIAGVDWVTKNHAPRSVANLSLGLDGNDEVDRAVQNSINAGVTVVVTAGNDSRDACTKSPARVWPAITVGAVDATDTRGSFSNYGGCVDLLAPGVQITAAWLNSQMNQLTGTSVAAPHVAGVAAIARSAHPGFNPQQIHDYIVDTSTKDVVRDAGPGSANRLLYLGGVR
jgi:subtilisin family serine protease